MGMNSTFIIRNTGYKKGTKQKLNSAWWSNKMHI